MLTLLLYPRVVFCSKFHISTFVKRRRKQLMQFAISDPNYALITQSKQG